ncbi:MAG: DUF58 domain-containing protein [Firmicutes bacterium]|nr:DUF58 domain-containing protein [Bacillota bacterium]
MSTEQVDQPKSPETSLLFERHVIWVLLALLLVAIWYRFVPLIIVDTFLIFLSIIIMAWKNMSLKRIEPALQLSKSRLFPGDEFLIHASVYNGKWLPLVWLEWSFPPNIGISFGDEKDDTCAIRFLWLLWFQRVKWTLNAKALQRGVYNIGQVTLHSGDGFRFAEIEQLHSLDGKLYVYPQLVPVHVSGFRPSMQWGVRGKQGGFIEDPLLVIGTREYQPGDELRRLNWRASARTGKLQANVYQPLLTEQLLIYIDVQGFVINETADAFERFLSVIASVSVKYREKGISIGFASNGLNYGGEKMPFILPGTNLTPLLDQLAQITQQVRIHKMAALNEMLHQGQLHIPLFFFSHHIDENHYLWYQQYKHKLSEVCFYYKNETEYANKLAAKAKPMDTFLSPLASSSGGHNHGAS